MKTYLLVVECAIEWRGKFLIIKRPAGKHAGGMLAFPGGKVDAEDEVCSQDMLRYAAKREVLEEVGLTLLDPLTYISSHFFVGSDGSHILDTIFHCVLDQTIPEVVASEREVPEYAWMTPTEILQADNAPVWLKDYIHLIDAK